MTDFRQKQKIKRVLYSRITLFFLTILIVIVTYNTWDIYKKERATKEILLKVQAEYSELQKREEFLAGEIQRLETDAGIEAEIRERYGVGRPGEEVIVLLEKQNKEEIVEEKGFWKKIQSWFE